VLPVSIDDSVLLAALPRDDALTRDYGVVCHTAAVAYHTVNGSLSTVPELPDLTVVAEELRRRIAGREVADATAPTPILLRATPEDLSALRGSTIGPARRRGKFLLLPFERHGAAERILAANPMLAGRFWLVPPRERVRARTGLRLGLVASDVELRYVDREMLGKLYLVAPDQLDDVPGWSEMGPDADDPDLTLEEFRRRIRRHPGELKPLLRNPRFVAGIGNAYSDEILWEARLAPFRKRSGLSDQQIADLSHAMRRVLADSVERVRRSVTPAIETQDRSFLKVHLRGGEPCPRCGRELRQIGGREATTFCRTCQPPV
jgi:formamidopyrimidine-DNA glycosylase